MSVHLKRQITRLRKLILQMGTLVEDNVELTIRSVLERDLRVAEQVPMNDREVDLLELEIEEECLHALALNQPVAYDLRYVIAVLKINNELERIGDLSVSISEQSRFLCLSPEIPHIPFDLESMALKTRSMLKCSLDALVNIDEDLARFVQTTNEEVNMIHRSMYKGIEAALEDHLEFADQYLHLMIISKNLERIADHADNIARDVVYISRGDINRDK